MLFSRPGKEPLGGCNVAPFAQEKVDGWENSKFLALRLPGRCA
jgi:hypothetical protein